MSFFDPELFESLREQRGVTWGRPVRMLEQTTSTNDEALAAIPGPAKTGIVWIARHQTRGRGRRGNAWLAPAGECLMFSTLLRYAGPRERLVGLSLAVGLAVCDAITRRLKDAELSSVVQVKWPNDVVVDGRKIAGILLETKRDEKGAFGIVVGIGLNVHTRTFPGSMPPATSLALLGCDPASLGFESLLVDVLGAMGSRISGFLTHGARAVLSDLEAVDFLRDRMLVVENIQGRARGFDEGGRLLVEDQQGRIHALDSGHVVL